MGFGDPKSVQPICHSEAEGRMMLDTVRAVSQLLDRVEGSEARTPKLSVFVAGFSQGGHAAFAAANIRRIYAPEVRLAVVIRYGPTTDIEALFREFSVVAPMAVYTFSRLYRTLLFDPGQILQQRWCRGPHVWPRT